MGFIILGIIIFIAVCAISAFVSLGYGMSDNPIDNQSKVPVYVFGVGGSVALVFILLGIFT